MVNRTEASNVHQLVGTVAVLLTQNTRVFYGKNEDLLQALNLETQLF